MRKAGYLAAVVLSMLVGVAAAQDAPSPPNKAVKKAAKQAKAAVLQDEDAIWAQGKAKEARARATCLQDAAKRIDAAAAALDATTEDQRQARDDEVTLAVVAMESCGQLVTPAVNVFGVSVEDPCNGDPLCDRDITLAQDLRDKLEKRSPGIARCYERGLARHPQLAGEIGYEMVLGKAPNVAIDTISAKSDTLGDSGVRTCIDKELRGLAFADSAAGLTLAFGVGLEPAP